MSEVKEKNGVDLVDELREKLKESEGELIKAQQNLNKITARGLKVHEENQMLKASEEVATKKAMMDYELKMCEQFIKSGAFKVSNAEQAYTVIQAGKEMNLSAVESLNTLYIVNGTIAPYGAGMISLLTRQGYKVEYLDETLESCRVRVTRENEMYEEVATKKEVNSFSDRGSKAYGFAPKHKLRFHGVRQIITFHLPHLFRGLGNQYDIEFKEQQGININRTEFNKQRNRILEHINNSQTLSELEMVEDLYEGHELVDEYNEKKELLEKLEIKQ